MHRTLLILTGSFAYFALAAFGLIAFHAGLLVTALALFGIPALVLARFSAAPAAVVISVMVFGAGIAVLLEGAAHIYGIWYTLGVDELRLFGLIPLEVIATSMIETLFLVLVYELFFDDGEYTETPQQSRFAAFLGFAVLVSTLIALHVYVIHGILFTHSYLWLIGILAFSTLGTLAMQRSLTLAFFKRLGMFTLITAFPLSISMIIAVVNTQRIFAFASDYVYSISINGALLPVEEIVLTLLLPMFVATFYEIYLDDGKLRSDRS